MVERVAGEAAITEQVAEASFGAVFAAITDLSHTASMSP